MILCIFRYSTVINCYMSICHYQCIYDTYYINNKKITIISVRRIPNNITNNVRNKNSTKKYEYDNQNKNINTYQQTYQF